jgi:hypothetical protein
MDIPLESAIRRAREALSLDDTVPAHASYVARLDRPGRGYYLTTFGPENASIAVAAVDAQSADISSHAHLSGTTPHLPVNATKATELAGTPLNPPRLVWRPSRASLSILSPIWEIRTGNGLVYIDQQGRRWITLEPAAPGG